MFPRLSRQSKISIPAPREEGDVDVAVYRLIKLEFLSTPPARRATAGSRIAVDDLDAISIHAPREEGDH